MINLRKGRTGLLACAYLRDGNPEQGFGALDAALAQIRGSRKRWYEAELLRLKAVLGSV